MHAHRSIYIGLLFALTVLLLAGPAWAAGDDGLGVYIGVTDTTITPDSPAGGTKSEISGVTFGVDYQFPLGESFSLNPFLMISSEEEEEEISPGVTGTNEFDTTVLALQLRYWIEGLYLGAHAGRYEVEVTGAVGGSETFDDTGFGAVIGWEGQGGFVLALQYDTFTVEVPSMAGPSTVDVEFTTLRALIGYRF